MLLLMARTDPRVALHEIEIQLWIAEHELQRLAPGAEPGLRDYWNDEIARLSRLAEVHHRDGESDAD